MTAAETPESGDEATETDSAAESDSTAEADADEAGPECPFCGSTDTEVESAFGSEVSKTQYYCNGCATVFGRIKFDGDLPDTGR
jgi:transposase-like protein